MLWKLQKLLQMKGFHSHLNRENVTYSDNKQTKRVCKGFGIKKVGYYHDLYEQRDTSLLADVFESFQNMSVEINELYCTKISMTTSFKKAKLKLDLLTDFDVILIVEKVIRGGLCYAIYWYGKANN